MMQKDIGVVTVARSDYGILKPVIDEISTHSDLRLRLYVAGMHLAAKYGKTVELIEDDGYEIFARVDLLVDSDTSAGIAKSIGVGTNGFAQSFSRFTPDRLVILGDRFEFLSPALASLPFNIPVAHLHGGELTEGVIDDYVRHALTKLSYLHFTSTETYRKRVIQMGEQPERVFATGAPGLDNIRKTSIRSPRDISKDYQFDFKQPFILATYHPMTLGDTDNAANSRALVDALDTIDLPVVFTLPNADTENSIVLETIREYVTTHPSAALVENFGSRDYFSAMSTATAMVGNSSSGIIEAASFQLPVVNIGQRQGGRIRGDNIIDVSPRTDDIIDGIETATANSFQSKISDVKNPYGDGYAAERIVKRLAEFSETDISLRKDFYDIEYPATPNR